jgi:acyl-[acyl-carrier-protein]-phospholipid O-acyltransferase/long-chain-fatty-acid--[acyl-carrier-protein] ligase
VEDFSSLRLVVAGAEPVKVETRRAWRERFGAEIAEGYGMTEASPVVAVNSSIHGREGSVGRLLPGMRMRIEPVEGIADGGRLWLSGPNIMAGTMSAERPGIVQQVLDGWHDTGDIVSVDREGFITIRGRAKRFAKIGGEMISLAAVEALATEAWPQAQHAAVALPDQHRGERIVLVTTAADANSAALHHVAKAAGASELLLPAALVSVAEIPTLGAGKTDYGEVRKLATTRIGAEDAAA